MLLLRFSCSAIAVALGPALLLCIFPALLLGFSLVVSIRDRVTLGEARVLQAPTGSKFAHVFTEVLPTAVFEDFRFSLNIHPDGVPTAAEGVLT